MSFPVSSLHCARPEQAYMEIQAARLLGGSTGERFYRICLGSEFMALTPKTPTTKQKQKDGKPPSSFCTEGRLSGNHRRGVSVQATWWMDWHRTWGLLQLTSELTRTWIHKGVEGLRRRPRRDVASSGVRRWMLCISSHQGNAEPG